MVLEIYDSVKRHENDTNRELHGHTHTHTLRHHMDVKKVYSKHKIPIKKKKRAKQKRIKKQCYEWQKKEEKKNDNKIHINIYKRNYKIQSTIRLYWHK